MVSLAEFAGMVGMKTQKVAEAVVAAVVPTRDWHATLDSYDAEIANLQRRETAYKHDLAGLAERLIDGDADARDARSVGRRGSGEARVGDIFRIG